MFNMQGGTSVYGQASESIDLSDMGDSPYGLNIDDIANIRANMQEHAAGYGGMDQLDYIVNDPRKTNEEIKALLEHIKPDVDITPENREGTPEGLRYPLVSFDLDTQP